MSTTPDHDMGSNELDASAFITDMGPAYEDLEDGGCTGSVWATGEDGMETVDHDGPCPAHDFDAASDLSLGMIRVRECPACAMSDREWRLAGMPPCTCPSVWCTKEH
jgi:hypothetical protein